jgi:uncharacterized protein YdhG (YjbR/CyaY superfamily)
MKKAAAAQTVDEYLAGVPEPARGTLVEVCAAIRAAVPPGTTEGISYRMPVFRYKGTLLWFAAFSHHCSLFPGAAVIAACRNDLKGFRTSKGTIQFPMDKPLSAALVKKLVKAAVAEKERKKPRIRTATSPRVA